MNDDTALSFPLSSPWYDGPRLLSRQLRIETQKMKVIRLLVVNGQMGTTHFIVCRVLEWAVGTVEAHEDILVLLRSTSKTILEVATLQLHPLLHSKEIRSTPWLYIQHVVRAQLLLQSASLSSTFLKYLSSYLVHMYVWYQMLEGSKNLC